MVIIPQWYGRFGNNVIQMLHALYYSMINGHRLIIAPPHKYLNNLIEVRKHNYNNLKIVINRFFYIEQLSISSPDVQTLKIIANEFKKIIIKKKYLSLLYYNKNQVLSDVTMHVRGGDVFSPNPPKNYLQPPLYYYLYASNLYSKSILVKEDRSNPVVDKMIYHGIQDVSSDFISDMSILINSKCLVMSYSTLSFVAYLLSDSIQTVYIPDYHFRNKELWPIEHTINLVKLPNYLENGSWLNTNEQRKMMVNYKYL